MLYLDHVDFGARHVSDNVPRITVWKGGMIQEYAEFDMKSTGSYGYHPLLDHSHTCYAKVLLLICKFFLLSFIVNTNPFFN